MKNRCHICRTNKSVAVRFREKSIISMCPKCITECSNYATLNTMLFMFNFIKGRETKCEKEKEFDDECYAEITTFIWLRCFNEWIEKGRGR
jgi:hypothetical protein